MDAREEARAKMIAAVESLTTSEQFLAYLAFSKSFHNMSWSNRLLIYLQNPEATRVKGFQQWKEFNRFVKKGEKAIKIIAPTFWKKEIDPETGEKVQGKLKGFIWVNVFDVSQTDGEPLPERMEMPTLDVTGDDHLNLALVHSIEGSGIPVSYACLEDGHYGFYRLTNKTITINETYRGGTQGCAVLLHEWAHALTPNIKELPTQESEIIAETAAWLAADHFGITIDQQAMIYLANWSKNGETFRKYLDVSSMVADDMIGRLEETLRDFHAETEHMALAAD